MRGSFVLASVTVGLAALTAPASGQTVRSASGTAAADITAARDQFRVDLGGGTVAGANGLFSDVTGARREINWDGVPDSAAEPNFLPATFFNVNSPRGAVFSTPGTGVMVSGGPLNPEFSTLNPSYPTLFAPFSPLRLFSSIGSNVYDVNFFVPGTNTPALTRGFGAVFSDVDLANTTSIQLFDVNNTSLGVFYVPAAAGNETFSFLGVSFPGAIVSRARVTQGNSAFGPNESISTDIVAADDFLFGEPVVPEPATLSILVIGAAGLMWRRKK